MSAERVTHEARVIVLESEMSHVKDCLEDLSCQLQHNTEMTLHIKEKLDKQNGAIPGIQENVKLLLSEHRDLRKEVAKQTENQAKNGIKIKVLWGMAGVIATAIMSYVINLILAR